MNFQNTDWSSCTADTMGGVSDQQQQQQHHLATTTMDDSKILKKSTKQQQEEEEVHRDGATPESSTPSFSPPPPSSSSSSSSSCLTRREKINLLFLVLSFACVVASLTLIVGTGAVVLTSIGASTTVAPFALACFFLGMAVVSLTLTHWIFERYNRPCGFWTGCFVSITGAGVGCCGLVLKSPALVLVANIVLGAGAGVAMYLRFAAVEVVSAQYASKAVAWTLCGGCLAAFVGPEAAALTKGAFGNDNLTYLGVFLVAVAFSAAQAIFVALIRFDIEPPTTTVPVSTSTTATRTSTNVSNNAAARIADRDISHQHDTDSGDVEMQRPTQEKDGSPEVHQNISASDMEIILSKRATTETTTSSFGELLMSSNFVLPLLISILSWSIMAMPMSIFRVTMRELGFTDRQSLTVIELHFLSMYMPGFWSGSVITRFGTIRACQVSIACSLLGTAINLSTQGNNGSTATWFLGLIFLGIGWNFGFSSATVWVQRVYAPPHVQHLKAKVQAANEFFTFLCSGGLIFSTGYLYNKAGGGGLFGWRLLNIVIGCLILAMIAVLYAAMKIELREKEATDRAEMAHTMGTTAVVDDHAAAVST